MIGFGVVTYESGNRGGTLKNDARIRMFVVAFVVDNRGNRGETGIQRGL